MFAIAVFIMEVGKNWLSRLQCVVYEALVFCFMEFVLQIVVQCFVSVVWCSKLDLLLSLALSFDITVDEMHYLDLLLWP